MNVNLFQRIVETLDDVITLQDAQGRLLYVSPSARRLLGLAPEQLLGTLGDELIHPNDCSRFEPLSIESPPGERIDAIECRCRKGDGSYRWVRAWGQVLRDASGQAFLLRRLSDLDAGSDPQGKADELRKRPAIGRLAGGIAHEFNNLLTVIAGYTYLLLEAHHPGDADHESLSHIQNAAERAADLVRQLLAVAGQQMLRPIDSDVNAIVLDLTELLKRILGPAIHLHLNLDPFVSPIQVDPLAIGQVLLDLAANARDAMPAGGQFTLTTANVAADALPPGMPPGPAVSLTAADNGRGMDEQTLRHLFEPFFTTKEVGQGTGLSLAAAHGVVRQCGGHLAVASRSGEGTTFTLTLPHVPPEE